MKTSALRLIKNNRAVLKLAPKRWPNNLPAPVHPADTRAKEIAVSALCGFVMRDGGRVYPCDLTNEQARDVASWASAYEVRTQ